MNLVCISTCSRLFLSPTIALEGFQPMVSALLLVIIYLSFISLGLPDSMLGAAWPLMFGDIGALVNQVGNLSMATCLGTIISALTFAKLAKRFSTGIITSVSILITSIGLLLVGRVTSFWMLYPIVFFLGLGGGCVDSALNNYVTLHYSTAAISFLHGFWGLGTIVGPLLLGLLVPHGFAWRNGYTTLSLIQLVICIISVLALPLWKHNEKAKSTEEQEETEEQVEIIPYKDALRKKAAVTALLSFIVYCAFENCNMVWGATYMVSRGLTEAQAATNASFFFWGMTIGRMLTGFIANKLGDYKMIRLGDGLMILGLLTMFTLPSSLLWLVFLLLGLGCAPVYPMMIHQTPDLFDRNGAAVLIGLQIASAYIGSSLTPPLFGFISKYTSMKALPLYLSLFLLLCILCTERKARVLKEKGARR
ncbi:MAG: MFS transporter [Spirochaetales bacterium]|nr:MFS transporter [Candidatus Physcosoma equi]